jgi:CheY-like chemotaxis protein
MVQARKIAVIDDDLASVEVLVKLLRKAGHDVHYFYDGLAAYD